MPPPSSHSEAFSAFAMEQGVHIPGSPIPVGVNGRKIQRCRCVLAAHAGRRDDAGWYIFFTNIGPEQVSFGVCGCWRCHPGENFKWRSTGPRWRVSEATRKEIARIEYEAALEQNNVELETARQFLDGWLKLPLCPVHYRHPYLVKKKVGAYGLKIGPIKPWEEWGSLIMPLSDPEDTPWTGQEILAKPYVTRDGRKYSKLNIKGGRVRGNFHWIGPEWTGGRAEAVVLAEGYATGASIYELLRKQVPVMICAGAGNIAHVAKVVRKWSQSTRIYVAADLDLASMKVLERLGNDPAIDSFGMVLPWFLWRPGGLELLVEEADYMGELLSGQTIAGGAWDSGYTNGHRKIRAARRGMPRDLGVLEDFEAEEVDPWMTRVQALLDFCEERLGSRRNAATDWAANVGKSAAAPKVPGWRDDWPKEIKDWNDLAAVSFGLAACHARAALKWREGPPPPALALTERQIKKYVSC